MAIRNARNRSSQARIVRVPGICGGLPTIAGTRIRVAVLVQYWRGYENVDRILEALPHLDRDQIAVALEYYRQHEDEIDREIQEDEELASRLEWPLRST